MGRSLKTHAAQVRLVRKKTEKKTQKIEAKDAVHYLQELEAECMQAAEPDEAETSNKDTMDTDNDSEPPEQPTAACKPAPEPEVAGTGKRKYEQVETATPKKLTHRVEVVPLEGKRVKVSQLLEEINSRKSQNRQRSRVVIFANDFPAAQSLLPSLSTRKTLVSHTRGKGRLMEPKGVGLLRSEDSEETVSSFKSGKYQVLITNDADSSVLWDLRHLIGTVINYDFPKHLGIYNNRLSYIGTVGNVKEHSCEVISVFTPSQANVAQAPHLVKYLRENGQDVPSTLAEIAALLGPGLE